MNRMNECMELGANETCFLYYILNRTNNDSTNSNDNNNVDIHSKKHTNTQEDISVAVTEDEKKKCLRKKKIGAEPLTQL